MAETTFIGKIETCLKSGMFITASDTSNPDPEGGLIICESTHSISHKQCFALVRSPELPSNTYVIVTHPKMDYKLRMSDRGPGRETGHTARIVEIVKIETKITRGAPLHPMPNEDSLFEVVPRGTDRVIRCRKEPRLLLDVAFGKVESGTPVLGEVCRNVKSETWRLVKSE